MQGTYAQKNQEKLIKIIFPDGLRRFCKSLILKGFKIASGLGNLLKPASILALRAVNSGLSTKLSTEIVDSLEMPYKPAS